MSNLFSSIKPKHLTIITWSLRIIIGATFVISGLSKSIDLWGFVYKIEQYFNVWGISVPSSIIVAAATGISFAEFLLGIFLVTGSYKRVCVWLLLMVMAVMLPLSIYIAIANPVDDCGCFGDFWVITNGATCLKNILLTAGLLYLAFYNKTIKGLYIPSLQWLLWSISMAYIIIVGSTGYRVQPLVDFRNYKEGTTFITDDSETVEKPQFVYIYEKDGVQQSFDESNLPDDTWIFVDRKEIAEKSADSSAFIIYDVDDEDVTEDVISTDGEQLILLISDIRRADISHTYTINELNSYMMRNGGSMIGIISSGTENMDIWKDLSMADYPIYTAEETAIKEFARGNISMAYLKDGIIQWKRTVSSIDSSVIASGTNPLTELYTNGNRRFVVITAIFLSLMAVLYLVDKSRVLVRRILCRKNEKKDVTLQQ